MAKLTNIDIPIIISLLRDGEKFNEIAKQLEVTGPTLRTFMLKNDLYKYSTNETSLKISQSSSKNTIGSLTNIEDIMFHKDDLFQEDVKFLEKLLKQGVSIGKIAKMYGRDRTTVRNYLKEIDLYDKYCEGNKFGNCARKTYLKRLEEAENSGLIIETKSENNSKEITNRNNIQTRPNNGKTVNKSKIEVIAGNDSKKEDSIKEVLSDNKIANNPKLEEFIKKIINSTSSQNPDNNECTVNDIVLNYMINKLDLDRISLDARLEDLGNTLMDKLISNFSEEELQTPEIKLEIKKTLVKLVEELL